MRHSIKTKLIWALSALTAGALLVGGGLLIWQNTQQMQREIYLDALSFAELTNEKIVTGFEQFYETENFLQFRKEANPLLAENTDVQQIEVVDKSNLVLYDSVTESEVSYLGLERVKDYNLDRVRNVKPSLLFSNGDIVYVKKNVDNEWVAVTNNEEIRSFPEGQVVNVIYPHKNARLSLVYHLTYDALWQRIYDMALSIAAVIAISILIVIFFANWISNRLVRPIKHLEEAVVKVGQGALGTQAKIETDDEIGVLAQNFNQMSKTLKKNTEELVEKEKLTKELDIAREIQENMLPKTSPELKNLDISGSLKPATSIGGDIFDYLSMGAKGTYIFIADVTGHGVPAGMIANITHSTLYSFSKVYEKPDDIMKAMNPVIHAKSKQNMFATALLARWNDTSRSLSYCNAGHEQIVYYDSATKTVQLVGKGGMALGLMESIDKVLKEQSIQVKKGDVLVLYTDGIPEAWRTEKENLGMERFQEIVQKVMDQDRDAKGIRESILKEVNAFRNNYPQQDDITIVVMKGK
ncbi:MAG: SpoIIE family protein phosphatase [Candidatus Altimarinota bacterium]